MEHSTEILYNRTRVYCSAVHHFGSDALLLARFSEPKRAWRAADLCSGCGIVSLEWHDRGHRGPCLGLELQPEASALLAAVYMARRVPELCPGQGQWRIRRDLLGSILRYGAVTAVQQAVQPICKVLIQGQVNALGVGAIAAFNAVTRVDDFAFTPEQSIATAITTYIAQNRGAGQTARIRRGFAVGLRLELGYWLLMGSLTLLLRRGILSLFVAGEGAADVIALGSKYLGWMAVFYALPALTNGFQGFYRGMGKMTTTLIGTCLQAGLRAAAAAVLAPRVGLPGIAFACAFGWCVMLAFEVPYYFWTCREL